MIGKRKREAAVVTRAAAADTDNSGPLAADAAHDVFRKYFEARFQPLDLPACQTSQDSELEDSNSESEGEDSDAGSEWDGLSDEADGETQVEVVEYTNTHSTKDDLPDKKARKAFMNAKPPSLSPTPAAVKKPTSTKGKGEEDDESIDALNLKNDLALQRLLKESHLLESASDLAPTGKNRHKAIDLRLQALGAKNSIFKQEKMPDSHRRGINAKATMKEERRRREAKENGIILEKPTFKSKSTTKRRERGVGGPSIGRFAGGTLNLSKRDLTQVARMQGSRGKSKGKPKGRR